MSSVELSRAPRGAIERFDPDVVGPESEAGWSDPQIRQAGAGTQRHGARSRRNGPRVLHALLRNPNALLGLGFLLLIVTAALAAPILYPDDPLSMVATPLLWPGQDLAFPLGSDSMGRDVLAGILWGSRISLLVGVVATVLGFGIGMVVGATAGYFGGWTDDLLLRVIEVFQTVPSFVLLIVLVAIAQPTVWTIAVGIAIVSWPTVARLTRAEFRSLREKDFVMAARGMGYSHARIIFREILPNALPPLIVTASMMVASAILMEASLSFMGLGDPNAVSWGSMIAAGRDLIRTAWYLAALPGFAIILAVLSLNLVADGLNDALNPRLSDDR